LYGSISFEEAITELIQTPVVQRLRHVRLSNIDSVDMPGIANISRFEHVLGVAHLASRMRFKSPLSQFDSLVLIASALLHDWAITSYGHLVEEALQYVGTGFEHELKLYELIRDEDREVIGGLDFQILSGRETNLKPWSKIYAGNKSDELLEQITKHISGQGRMGRVISGDIDIDNIDNVFRMAFHMGIPIDKGVPLRLSQAIIGVDPSGPIFSVAAKTDIENWRLTRQTVYQHLMLAQRDFIGKVMMLYASVVAFRNNEITKEDWSLVDHTLLATFIKSPTKEVRDTVQRWVSGDLWVCTPLLWMKGNRPDYTKLLEYSDVLTDSLKRQCFAYGIKDKRNRQLTISFDNGTKEEFGEDSRQWLFGVGSSKRAEFTISETDKILALAQSFFGTEVIAPAIIDNREDNDQACLF
jgi:HD superfamily phosphohydrolase